MPHDDDVSSDISSSEVEEDDKNSDDNCIRMRVNASPSFERYANAEINLD
jgi:hypothetical protein